MKRTSPSNKRRKSCRPRRQAKGRLLVEALEPRALLAVLTYSTYLGGSRNDQAEAVAAGPDGSAYVVGRTFSNDLVPGSGPDDARVRGFVAKFDGQGQIVYRRLLGPVDSSSPYSESDGDAVAVGPDGLPIISYALTTYSDPDEFGARTTTGATRHIEKLTQDGHPVFDITVHSWTLEADRSSIAVDENGAIYISSLGLDTVPLGVQEHAFLDKLDANGTSVFTQPWYTHGAVAVDAQHNIYLATFTSFDGLPVTTDALQPRKADAIASYGDIYVMELDPTGSGPIAATYLGGAGNDTLGGLAVNPNQPGIVYLTGTTTSTNFPVKDDAYQSTSNTDASLRAVGGDGFITVLDLTKMKLVASTFFGGENKDVLTSIALDHAGNVYVAGTSNSPDFPVVNPVQATFADGPPIDGLSVVSSLAHPSDFVIAKFNPNLETPSFSTYVGGTGNEDTPHLAVDSGGGIYVAGTSSGAYRNTTTGPFLTDDFPVRNNAQPAFAGGDGGRRTIDDPFLMTDAVVFRLGQDLKVTARPVNAFVGMAYTTPVATFTAPDPMAPTTNFTAKINWGDGSATQPEDGIVQKTSDPAAPFQVVGSHTYAKPGSYPVVVTVTDVKDKLRATTTYNVSEERDNQTETTIAIDPTNPKRVFAAANDFLNPDSLLFAAYSEDGGINWIPSIRSPGILTPAAGTDVLPTSGGDPRAVFDPFGNLYLAELLGDFKSIAVLLSADGGKTFRVIGDFPSLGDVAPPGSGEDPEAAAVDQPSIAVTPGDLPGTASVWISYADVDGSTVFAAGARVTGFNQSTFDFQMIDLAHGEFGNFGNIAVGPMGQVVVTWENFGDDPAKGPSDAIMVSTNPDGLNPGSHFSGPVALSPALAIGDTAIAPQATRKITPTIRLAWDTSGKAHDGRIYMAYTDALAPATAPDDTDIFVRFSDDGGTTWSPPVRVNDDAGGHSQFFASIAVDQSTGDLGVGWYDARNSVSNTLSEYFVAISGDGGRTFSANVAVSTGPSDASDVDLTARGAENQYGDYTGLSFAHGLLYPIWGDNSTEQANNPDPPQFEVATGRIAIAHVTISPPVVTPFRLPEGSTFEGQLATFTDADSGLSSGDFTVTINWGEGPLDTSSGTITQGAPGTPFIVRGSHRYAEEGAYPIVVTITDTVNDVDGSGLSDINVSHAPGNQSEENIAVDPTNPSDLFAVSNDGNGDGLFAAVSSDGGATWQGHLLASGVDLPLANGDPKAVFDPSGNLFLTYLTADLKSIVLALSSDDGQTFTRIYTFAVEGGTTPPGSIDPEGALVDQPSVAAGVGSVWVSFANLADGAVMAVGAPVTGRGTVGDFGTPQAVPDSDDGNFGGIAIGPNGQVLVSFVQQTPGVGSVVSVSLDADGLGPGGFATPVVAARTKYTDADLPAQSTRGVEGGAFLAWDGHLHDKDGRVYLVYTDTPAIGSMDTNIFVRVSNDRGATWSDPVRVNDDGGTNSQFLPSIAVDPQTGDVAVGWYDARNDPGNVKTQFFIAGGTNGGSAFSTNLQVSNDFSDATDAELDDSGQENQYGDYTGIAVFQGMIYPVWADNNSDLDGIPDPPQFDLAMAHVAMAGVDDAPLTAQALDISADVNDEGEEFTADLATFRDADPNGELADYTATIDWGDKTEPSAGKITGSGGPFVVSGTHAYEEEGSYTITITIRDKGGASVMVVNDADIEDGTLTATGRDFKPVEDRVFGGVVATFTDSDPNGQPGDYRVQIDWGDGGQSPGSVSVSGSAALTWDPFTSAFFAIGNDDHLTAITTAGVVTNVMALDPSFHRGGLALDNTHGLYAISNTDVGQSTLNALDLVGGTFHPILDLGTGFTGGLAFDSADGNFYAIADDGNGSSLYQINLGASTVAAVADLGSLSHAFFAGLTFNPLDGNLYAAGNDSDGASTLYRISPSGAFSVAPLFVLGTGFMGGLAVVAGGTGGALHDELVGIAGDGSGSAVLDTISLDGPVAAVFEVGANFNDGWDITGTHAFGAPATLAVAVSIADVGGSKVTAQSSATIVHPPPRALPAPPTINVLQGIPSGPLLLARFNTLGGPPVAPTAYTASIHWGDGDMPGDVTIVGSVITVTGEHTFGQFAGQLSVPFTSPVTVTLTDDTGNSALSTIQITSEPDISWAVRSVGSGLIFNPSTQHFVGDLNVASTVGIDFTGPFYAVIDQLPAGVTVANAPALTADGNPLFTVNVPVLSAAASLPPIPLEFSDLSMTPISYRVRVIDGPGGPGIGTATIDQVVVTNKPIVAVEGAEFSGVVASFVVPASQPQAGFTATIDWGDGTVSPGTIRARTAGLFDVVGTHTYQRQGSYRVPIVVRDASGAAFSAGMTPADASVAGSVTYQIRVDTTDLQGTTGFLSFQFNAGALPGAPGAAAHVTQFVAHDAALLAATEDGATSGDLTTELIIAASGVLNRFTQKIQFGDEIAFDLTIDGAGIATPALGLFGDAFGIQLLAADGKTPLLSADQTAAALKIDVQPDGSTQSHALPRDTPGGPSVASASAFDVAAIRNAPITALQMPISGVEGADIAGIVATFASANPFEVAADFTAVVDWGDGTATTPGSIAAAANGGGFVVTATHHYVKQGDYAFTVTVMERDGLIVQAAGPAGAPDLQAGRRTFTGGREVSGQLKAIGDFNRDGVLDVAIPRGDTTIPSNNLVLLGAGDGSFAVTTLPALSHAIVTADFNNDGFLDMAVAPASGPIAIYLGKGDGTFGDAVSPAPNYGPAYNFQTIDGAYDLAVGDLDHDGNMDLVASVGGTPGNSQGFLASYSEFLVLHGKGDGTFDFNPLDRGGSFDSYFLLHTSLQLTDINGDGNLDVVALDGANGVLRVCLGLGNGAFGRDVNGQVLTIQTTLPAGAELAAIADLNGDGKLDMAVTCTDHVAVMFGNGDGTFQPPTSYDAPGAYDVIAADFNGDGLLDLVVTNPGDRLGGNEIVEPGDLYMLLNTGDGVFATPKMTVAASPMHLAAGDFNGDGRTDVFLTSEHGISNVLFGKGDGSFVTAQRYDTGAAVDDESGHVIDAARAADVNGDGFQDVVLIGQAQFAFVGVRLANGDGTFQPIRSTPLNLFGTPTEIAFGDINHDGKMDMAIAALPHDGSAEVRILLGNGDGTFQPGAILSLVGTPSDIVLADIDHDGNLDLVVGGAQNAVVILPGNGDGTFQNPISVPFPGRSVRIAVGDFNHDGNLDVATVQPGTTNRGNTRPPDSEVDVVLNQGDGTFLPALTYDTSPAAYSIISADVNGDGFLDLIIAADQANYYVGATLNEVNGSIGVLLNRGDGTFYGAVQYGDYAGGYFDVTTADVDGDGHLDIIAAAESGATNTPIYDYQPEGLAVLHNQGDGTFGAPIFYDTAGMTIGRIAAADFNGDGLPDVLTPNSYDNTISIVFDARASGHAGASIADAPITVSGADLQPGAGLSFTRAAGTFRDANPFSVPGDFTAIIDWGDGQTSSGAISANSSGGFDVIGTHGYAVSGHYVTGITVNEIGGGSYVVQGSATVRDASDDSFEASGAAVFATGGVEQSGVVATILTSNGQATAADFQAAIDWGDGTSSVGDVVARDGGRFDVHGTHSYHVPGTFIVRTTITPSSGVPVTTVGTAQVVAAAPADRPPAAQDDQAISTGRVPVRIAVLVNDGDPDGDPLAIDSFTQGRHGSVALNADRTLTYSPSPGFDGVDNFRYTISDGHGGLSSATVTVITTTHGETSEEVPPPTVVSVRRRGVHLHPTSLIVTFNGPLDPETVQDRHAYIITTKRLFGKPGTRHHRIIPIRWVSYDPNGDTVTIRPSHRLDFHRRYRFTVRGTGPHALRSVGGIPLDANGDGRPGGDLTGTLKGFRLRTSADSLPRLSPARFSGEILRRRFPGRQ